MRPVPDRGRPPFNLTGSAQGSSAPEAPGWGPHGRALPRVPAMAAGPRLHRLLSEEAVPKALEQR